MIDSLMPLSSDTSGLPSARRSKHCANKRPSVETEVPKCKKRKKSHHHHWPKKSKHSSDVKKRKNGKKIRPKPEAPFNSTQFIMEEHDDLNDSDLSTEVPPRRRRDSTPSVDSDIQSEDMMGHLYPADAFDDLQYHLEESYMSEQFWTTYNDLNAERLHNLTKAELVQEYFAVEEKLNILERELVIARAQDRTKQRIRQPSLGCDDEEVAPGEVPVDAESATKIEVFRAEIQKLTAENETLRMENEALQKDMSSPMDSCRRCGPGALPSVSSNPSDDEAGGSSSSSSDPSASDEESAMARKLLLSSLSPPSVVDEEAQRALVTSEFVRREKLSKSTVDLVSDSGIASASSGDDLRLEDRDDGPLGPDHQQHSARLNKKTSFDSKIEEMKPVKSLLNSQKCLSAS